VGDTTGVHIEGNSFAMPATPPPDIDLKSGIILRRHFGAQTVAAFSHALRLFRQSFRAHSVIPRALHRWSALAEEILRNAASDFAAMDSFMSATFAEISQHLPAGEGPNTRLQRRPEISLFSASPAICANAPLPLPKPRARFFGVENEMQTSLRGRS